MFFNKKKSKALPDILPRHIAIIMDGNGRWAKRRGMPRSFGHRSGAQTFRTISKYCNEIGIEYLTVYAFSTENWSRPKEEVDFLMNLFKEYLEESLSDFKNENIRTRFIGDRSKLPQNIVNLMNEAEEATADKTGLTLNIAINYGGRLELVNAVRSVAEKVANGEMTVEEIDEEIISQYLYTAGQPDPDLIIRPSGEQRLSNFLLWQSAYSEFLFSKVLWPDYTIDDLVADINEYAKRSRRFGGVK